MFAKCARIALLGKVRQTTGINHGAYSYTKQSKAKLENIAPEFHIHTHTHIQNWQNICSSILFSYPRNFYNKQIKQKHRKGRQYDGGNTVIKRERELKRREKKNELKHVHLSCENEKRKVLRLQNTNERKQNRQLTLKERCGNGERKRKPEEKLQSTNSLIESYVRMMS